MKEEIIKKAGESFLKYGFKSVTMDDIANDLAISKKTIYKHFKNKVELVENTISYFHEMVHNTVMCVCDKEYNAIQENFEIKKIFSKVFEHADNSPMYQLQKYYPKIHLKIIKNEFSMFKDCILKNIEKGIEEEIYRKNIDKELTTKFYFSLMMSVHDTNLHTYNKNTISKLELKALEYHIRAIATLKGLKILEEQLDKNSIT
ncbi:TetR/AcrR family transcriptional regulator [Lutibacter sp. A80]|uniref:TetR/AcrR family transcriptional regulator n=1 Tax=Lutibacter sp. A80 TaxID=2918453 RepID=UPI001F065CB9|nr:TetR/AcrR family transcriptional regulator [Lutibacter sp. A80]UMB59977.1 TetR/AcrR family transcriptional regulator [Lutibacter sp. A80]